MTVLLLAGSAAALGSAPAQAATGQCAGNRIEHLAVKTSGGTTKGHLNIYYNPSSGYNCARLDSYGSHWGRTKQMSVTLHTCKNKTSDYFSCKSIQIANDDGHYAKYAGPVKVYGKGRCIAASAVIDAGRNEAVKVTPCYHC
ncbi:hypothetical protein ACIBKY_07395 [Nonomuraea sp. NPDC050394]|uniref:hypothetical protein n=1 Tax=Nonomuraea sp. NPDC050394 TaxID=3364363 RepID=UPI0037ACE022